MPPHTVAALPLEPDGQQFGKPLQGGEETDTDNNYLVEQVVEGPKVEPKEGPMGDITLPTWGLKDAYLKEAQSKDALCQRIICTSCQKRGEGDSPLLCGTRNTHEVCFR